MFLMHTEKRTPFHNRIGTRRGFSWPWNPDICFPGYQRIDQEEEGATIEHTFIIPGWEYCHTKRWIFFGWQYGLPSDSTSNIFSAHFETYRSDESMRHIDLTHKEVDDEIDHAHHSITPRKMLYPWLWQEFPYTPTADPTDAYQVANKKYVDDHIPPEAQGFRIKWTTEQSGHDGYGGVAYNHDAIRADINYTGDVRSAYSTRMYGWNFVEDHKISFWSQRGVNAAGTIHAFAGIQDGDRDIFSTWSQPHIGFEHSNNRLYATNGGGAARTVTDLGVGILALPAFLSWVRTAGKIEYFINGLLVATHTTNVPGALTNLFFNFRCHGTYNAPRHISIGCPLYESPQQTFSLFPFTPAAAPTQDYHVANKKYVDDAANGVPGMWELIAQEKLAAPVTNYTFDGISDTWDMLRLHVRIKADSAGSMRGRINDREGPNYLSQYVQGQGATASAIQNTNLSWWSLCNVHGQYITVGDFIFSTNPSFYPSYVGKWFSQWSVVQAVGGHYWLATEAITKLFMFHSGGVGNNFEPGTTFRLEGFKV